ncbi:MULTISPECIES: transglycosylase domain-containing protein [unclassified Leucobacter]|uniref:transglycosylase domain-containing protein n=1 Tax=unclassified Leucobacter TaxID=2621730 RepID=UPI00165DAD83|nr:MULTISPECIES: transglycosylase domain-containing protein [unclassified Leucobacter]MBC9937501.1 transglycosylase domain-containing protein [Leucobacter sp. cx-87]
MTEQPSTPSRARKPAVRTTKKRTAGGALGGILGAIAMSVVAGLLVTAAVTPLVAVSGAAATSAISIFENLPDHLDPGKLAEPSTIYAQQSDGNLAKIAQFYAQDRVPVAWDQIPQYVKDAAVAEEDPRFYTHGGVDIFATTRAVLQNLVGSSLSGASTITMQYVRNVLVQEAESIADPVEQEKAYENAMRQDADRKLKEMKYAISIEKKSSKDEILLGYLNIALFGRQIYGIQSAAQYYYGKEAKDLTLAESASLVAIVNNPSKLQIDIPDNIPANTERRDKILDSMLRTGKITEAQHAEAVATVVTPVITPKVAGCTTAAMGLGQFCKYVQLQIQNDPAFGNTAEERMFNFQRGGYNIVTTIDLDMQASGQDAVSSTIPAVMDGIDVGAAGVSTEVGTGKIRAMVQNRAFSEDPEKLASDPTLTSINYNTDFEYGGSSGFQVASTFKPFTLAEWIRTGHSVRDIVNVNGRTEKYQNFRAQCLPEGVYGYGTWKFENDNNGTRGNQPVLTAISQSVNGGLVSMQQKMDLCDTIDLAEKMGVHRASKQTNPEMGNFGTTDLSITPSNVYSGVDEIAPLTMALAYGGFAGNGTVCTPTAIERITDTDGNEVPFTAPKCTQAIEPEVAAGVAYALEYTVNNGLARHARSPFGIPHIGKTGTSDDVVDNWTVGGSSKVTTAVWVGNVTGKVSTRFFGNLMVADQRIWPALMNVADQKYGGDAFPEPNAAALKTTMQSVPDTRGKSYEEAEAMLSALGFSAVDGGEADSEQPAGTVARTDPDGGGQAPAGSGITIYRSNGSMSAVPDLGGGTGNDARTRLQDAGFSATAFVCAPGNNSGNPGSKPFVSSSPAAGEIAKRSSQVTITVDCA